jgi:hypothetical protein
MGDLARRLGMLAPLMRMRCRMLRPGRFARIRRMLVVIIGVPLLKRVGDLLLRAGTVQGINHLILSFFIPVSGPTDPIILSYSQSFKKPFPKA